MKLLVTAILTAVLTSSFAMADTDDAKAKIETVAAPIKKVERPMHKHFKHMKGAAKTKIK